jgi:hypothetical protein
MAAQTPAEKMLLKPGMSAALLHVPAELHGRLGLPGDVVLVDDPARADFLLDFAATQAEAEQRLAALKPAVGKATLAWLGYPKGSKAAGLDLNRDTIAGFARSVGLVVVAIVALGATWSAVRVRPSSDSK